MIVRPTKKQLLNLRLMIVIGLCCMGFFIYTLCSKNAIGNRPLYYLLISTILYTSFKIIYEWYHYWSITVPTIPGAERNYTVDVFTTFFKGEPYDMILETLTAIKAITYPHETYLCDEADDPFLKQFCLENGIHHVTRIKKIDAKAGNINNALRQSYGELCLVLDPDHVPQPNFLDPIVNHFNNPAIGFVQVVQAYFNQDQGWIAKGAAQQTYQFYGPMMMTMNAYGTVQAIGANCTFRRTALESIGGHAAGLAEDMHTAMQLHAKGWKSVYVPEVLAKGLVPATLSAYYKQQIKWSRGVFELLVTSYVKLFTKFSWRQKLHYGLIPLFYLSGFVFLINFFIPVASLIADVYPLRMDFSSFMIVALPFIVSVILIRHYVQRWVMEDEERGFHVIGGLLLIGTWWVFIVGFIYTIIRKEVPYIPTPKNIEEEKNLNINLPNIAVLVISIGAIIFGLYNDWNPFTFIMAGICSINCVFMVFMLIASEQHKFRTYNQSKKGLVTVINNISSFKRRFWLLRRKLYSGIRTVASMLIVLTVCLSLYINNRVDNDYIKILPTGKKDLFLSGFAMPTAMDVNAVSVYQSKLKQHLAIVAIGDIINAQIPAGRIAAAYKNRSIPMVSWSPVVVVGGKVKSEAFVNLKRRTDAEITIVARQLAGVHKPLFLQFAPGAGKPNANIPDSSAANHYKIAWRHVHHLFVKNGASNVIWVWNPAKAKSALTYFPGASYVDWLAISAEGAGVKGTASDIDSIYQPFRRQLLPYAIPVLLTGMPASKDDNQPLADGTMKLIKKRYPEIKGIIVGEMEAGKLAAQSLASEENTSLKAASEVTGSKEDSQISTVRKPTAFSSFDRLRGVLYTKGQNWYGNPYALTKKIIAADFREIQNAGISTVRIYGPSVYDRSTMEAVEEVGLKVHYSFWVPDPKEFINDPAALPALAKQIIETVEDYRGNKDIVAWNIGNATIQRLEGYFYKPDLYYRQQAYVTWLQTLVKDIKAADPSRPVTADVLVSPTLKAAADLIQANVPQLDAIGLVLEKNLADTAQIAFIKQPYYYSNADARLYFKLKHAQPGVIIGNWQDQQTAFHVTFNGLKDLQGRNKPEFYQVVKHWRGGAPSDSIPDIKILRPALTTEAGLTLPYSALVYQQNNWHLAQYLATGLKFEWYQVKLDGWGQPIAIKYLGSGALENYTIPPIPERYRLYLVASKGRNVKTAFSILNIPLKQ